MAILLTIVAFMASAVSVASAAEQTVFSQIIHRHGSRSPLVPANASVLCPPVGCGVLNSQGVDMLNKLGTLIRTRYQTLNSGYFDTTYDFNTLYTRSTAIPRTIQSGEAFLKGLFSAQSDLYPVVFNVPKVEDTLLLSDSWPNMFFYMKSNLPKFYADLDPIRQSLMTDETVMEMAEELSLPGLCEEKGLSACSIVFYDVAAAFEATGTLATYATVNANYGNLKTLALDYFKLTYGWDANKPSDVLRGSPGQPVAQALIKNMKDFVAEEQPFKFIHYSAHDSTISPLGVTLGDTADDVMLPGFGVMFAIDLVSEDGAYYVRGIKGTPQQTDGPHTYTTSFLKLGGIDAAGDKYFATSLADRIPLDDFVRFVDSTAPTSSLGQCAVPADQVAAMGCDKEGAPTTDICKMYRTNCMATACPAGTTLEYSTLACRAASSRTGEEATMTTANAGVMAMCTTFGGMLIGAGAMFAVNHFAKKREQKKYENLNSEETLNAA